MTRCTVHDVAREAGVSLATVDRVLNGREGVRPATASKVHGAVAKLGYLRDIAAANLARGRAYHFLAVIPIGDNSFMRHLHNAFAAINEQNAAARSSIKVISAPPFDSAALATLLSKIDPDQCDGVAIVATDAPEVRAAIDALMDAGVHVVTLVSDLPSSRRAHFVGIDNIAAGRSAGSLMGRFLGQQAGSVAFIAGSLLVRDHVERRLGFDQSIRKQFPNINVLPPLEGLDDLNRTEAMVSKLLDSQPDLLGIYSAGGGNRGLYSALERSHRSKQIVTIVHELTRASRQGLIDGCFDAVIHQDPGHEARSAIRLLKSEVDKQAINWSQERIRIEIFIRENLP